MEIICTHDSMPRYVNMNAHGKTIQQKTPKNASASDIDPVFFWNHHTNIHPCTNTYIANAATHINTQSETGSGVRRNVTFWLMSIIRSS